MPEALVLFGSVARGSADSQSDIDLLAVGGATVASSMKSNGVEVQNYSTEKFMSLAKEGDLFGAHIAMEGKAIFDPHNIFVRFREEYTLKENYETEISNAFDLATYLLFYGKNFPNQDLVARRVAWAVRTVLIATLAERRKFVFSPEGLKREFPFNWTSPLIDLRRNGAGKEFGGFLIDFLRNFEKLSIPFPESHYLEKFSDTNNAVALGSLRKLNSIAPSKSNQYSPEE